MRGRTRGRRSAACAALAIASLAVAPTARAETSDWASAAPRAETSDDSSVALHAETSDDSSVALRAEASGAGTAAPRPSAEPEAGGAPLRWRNRPFRAAEAPEGLAQGSPALWVALESFAALRAYRVDVSDDGRVAAIGPARHRSVHGVETAVRRALEAFDELFPGAGPGAPVVVARVASEDDAACLRSALAALAAPSEPAREPEIIALATFGEALGAKARRIDEGRYAGAVATALLEDRYGALPTWFVRGAALAVEERATGRFASVDPSITARAWRADVERRYADGDESLELDLARLGWRPDDLGPAEDLQPDAWALVEEVAKRSKARGLGPLAVDLARRVADSRHAPAAGAGPDAQEELLEAHAGEGLLDQVARDWAIGRVAR